MVSARTTGMLNGFTIVQETNYGQYNSAGTKMYGGNLITLDDKSTLEWTEDNDSSRTFDRAIVTGHDYGFTAEFRYPRKNPSVASEKRLKDWINLAYNSGELPSFSAKFNYASDEKQAFFGCKVNEMTIKADGRGKPLSVTVDAIARYGSPVSANDTFSNIYNGVRTSVSFESATRPDRPPLTYCLPPSISINGVVTPIKASSWTLSIKNNLQKEADAEYILLDSECIPLAAGLDSVEGQCEITLTLEVLSTSSFWDEKKQSELNDFTATVSIDNANVTLSHCYLLGDMPNRSNKTYNETITIKAKSLSA